MRKVATFLLLAVVVIGFTTSCEKKSESNLKITMVVTNGDDNTVYLSKRESGEWIDLDSVQLIEGKAVFSGNIDLPEFYYLKFKGTRNSVPVFS